MTFFTAGKKIFGGADRYLPTNIRYGYRPITVSNISHIGNNIFVYGEGFNEYSHTTSTAAKRRPAISTIPAFSAGNIVLHTGDRVKVVQVTTDLVEVGESDIYEISASEADAPTTGFTTFLPSIGSQTAHKIRKPQKTGVF